MWTYGQTSGQRTDMKGANILLWQVCERTRKSEPSIEALSWNFKIEIFTDTCQPYSILIQNQTKIWHFTQRLTWLDLVPFPISVEDICYLGDKWGKKAEVAVNSLHISSTYLLLDCRGIREQPRKHLKFTFSIAFKSLFLIRHFALLAEVDISADFHVISEGNA